jgi:hypothetical protein
MFGEAKFREAILNNYALADRCPPTAFGLLARS